MLSPALGGVLSCVFLKFKATYFLPLIMPLAVQQRSYLKCSTSCFFREAVQTEGSRDRAAITTKSLSLKMATSELVGRQTRPPSCLAWTTRVMGMALTKMVSVHHEGIVRKSEYQRNREKPRPQIPHQL